MKKYTNITSEMRSVRFKDKSVQFLRRGQTFQSDKAVDVVQEGIRVSDIRVIKRPKVDAVDVTKNTKDKEQK